MKAAAPLAVTLLVWPVSAPAGPPSGPISLPRVSVGNLTQMLFFFPPLAASSVARVADKQRREQQELLEILGILYGFASNLWHQHSSVRTVTAPVLSSLSMSGTSKSVIPFLSTGGSLTVSWSVMFASVQHFLLQLHSMLNNVQSANFKQLSAFFVNFQSILTRPEGIRQKTEALGHARRNFSPKSC